MSLSLLRAIVLVLSLIALLHWAAGKRAFRITFGTLWFLLTRPPVALMSIVGTIGMAALMWSSAIDNGKDPSESAGLLLGISVLCGVGLAALVVPPVWMLMRSRMPKPELKLPEGETVLREWKMNHFSGLESRGGRGYLTQRALYFVPHRFSVQQDLWSIRRDEIASAEVAGGRLLVLQDSAANEHLLVIERPQALSELLTSTDSASPTA